MRENTVNGRYRILRLLGRGAQARVYEAQDLLSPDVGRVALKVLTSHTDAALEEALTNEYAHLAVLEHPAFVRVHALGRVTEGPSEVPPGSIFLAEELLDAWFLDEGLPPRQDRKAKAAFCWDLLAQVSEALVELHAHGLLHGDIKPSNLAWTPRGFRILDLGLAAPRGSRPGGTPGFAAPEALAGVWDPRSDLYSLAATTYWLATGRHPRARPGASVQDLAAAAFHGELVPLRNLAPWLPRRLAEILEALLARDPAERFQDAAQLHEAVETARPGGSSWRELSARKRLRPTPLLGRERELGVLHQAWRAAQAQGPQLVFVSGPEGSGRSRLVTEFLLAVRLQAASEPSAPTLVVLDGTWEDLSPNLVQASGHQRSAGNLPGWPRGLVALRGEPPPEAEAFLEAVALSDGGSQLLVLAETSPESNLAGRLGKLPRVREIRLEGLSEGQTQTFLSHALGGTVPQEFAAAARASTAGLPGRLRRLAELVLARGLPLAAGPHLQELSEELHGHLPGKLSASESTVLAALGLLGGRAGVPWLPVRILQGCRLRDLGTVLARLAERDLVRMAGGRIRLAAATLGAEALQGLSQKQVALLARRLLRNMEQVPAPPTEEERIRWNLARARLLLAGRPGSEKKRQARRVALQAASDARRQGWTTEERLALELARRAGAQDFETADRLAELLARAGRLQEALSVVQGSWRAPEERLRAALRRAVLLRRASRPAEALQALDAAEPNGGADSQLRVAWEAARLRSLLDAGRLAEARDMARGLHLPDTLSPDAVAWLEAYGLVLLSSGEPEQAHEAFRRALELARRLGDRAMEGRCRNLAAMASQTLGRPEEALSGYEAAVRTADEAGDLHGRGIYVANRGALLLELGRTSEAVEDLTRAVRHLAGLGQVSQLSGALVNLAHALLALGHLEAAAQEAVRAVETAESDATRGHALLLLSEILGRDPDLGARPGIAHIAAGAAEAARQARAAFRRAGDHTRVLWADAQEVLALALEGAHARALRPLAGKLAESLQRADEETQGVCWQLLARACAETGQPLLHALPAEELLELARSLAAGGRREQAWRLAAQAARALVRAWGRRDAVVRALADLASRHLVESRNVAGAASAWDPDVAAAREARRELDASSASPGLDAPDTGQPVPPEALLAKLLEIGRAIARRSVQSVLEEILDAVVDLTGAERGFLLLVEGDRLEVRASRNISQADTARAWSRSIAERAMEERTPVLTVDAAADERFATAASVMDLKLRSVLAVPFLLEGEPIGCLYLDARMRRHAFGSRHADLALALAEQAAVAIRLARLLEEEARHRAEIEELNQRLARRLDETSGRLEALEREMAEARARLDREFEGMVGATEAMQEVFRLIERVAPTDLPVIVTGESGTGKELVARAIHNRSRRAGRFASENCGAVPENLLESILFGHEKGAFTGAARRHRGLFELAHGGTLFLDELEEMSPAMQVKLLRVLQEGTFRRLGGEEDIAVDVRVLAATNQDIEELVRSGKLRKDLYYRLNVVRIELPPLRERIEDIPLLAAHFLEKYGRPDLSISPRALAAMMGYEWPGNVRELENEIMRLAALSDDRIRLEDLSPPIRANAGEAPPDGAELDLKAQVQALQRRLIREALRRTNGNKSRAAELLGLSRYGLQKMMARLGLR